MQEKTDDFDAIDTEIEVEVNDSQAKCKTRFISLHSPVSVREYSNVPETIGERYDSVYDEIQFVVQDILKKMCENVQTANFLTIRV